MGGLRQQVWSFTLISSDMASPNQSAVSFSTSYLLYIDFLYLGIFELHLLSMAASFSLTLSPPVSKPNKLYKNSNSKPLNLALTASLPCKKSRSRALKIVRAVSISDQELRTGPEDLVALILSKVTQTDGGVLLAKEQHNEVAEVAQELQKFCVEAPVKCPLIFGEWDVVYCSVPTSPGGGYRSAFGRLFFKTKEMIQSVEAPDTIRNNVAFTALGFLDGEVSLKGKLNAMDDKWIQVVFEPPELKVGGMEFRYGGESEVKLQITYIDEKIRLGLGSRGSLFVFQRRKQTA